MHLHTIMSLSWLSNVVETVWFEGTIDHTLTTYPEIKMHFDFVDT